VATVQATGRPVARVGEDLPPLAEGQICRDDQRENRELKKANEPPRVSPRSSTSPTEVSAFIDERRADFGVELICRTRRRPLRAGGGARQKAAMIRISNEPRDGVRLYAFG
jgi:hypothetical protein